jgi:hypothetical protein
MNRFIIVGMILILGSCEQNVRNKNDNGQTNDAFPSNMAGKTASIRSTNEPVKHETFNENIDSIPENLSIFIPTGYSVINISSGDANLDGLIDKMLVLRKNTEQSTSNYVEGKPDKRPLLLLLGESKDTYKLIYRNDNVVYCIDCGGAFGDPFTGTTIKNGYFSIESGIAGGQHWEQVITFKYDLLKSNWFLYKDHSVTYKMNDSNDVNAEALVKDIDTLKTQKDFGVIPFETFNMYNEDGN